MAARATGVEHGRKRPRDQRRATDISQRAIHAPLPLPDLLCVQPHLSSEVLAVKAALTKLMDQESLREGCRGEGWHKGTTRTSVSLSWRSWASHQATCEVADYGVAVPDVDIVANISPTDLTTRLQACAVFSLQNRLLIWNLMGPSSSLFSQLLVRSWYEA